MFGDEREGANRNVGAASRAFEGNYARGLKLGRKKTGFSDSTNRWPGPYKRDTLILTYIPPACPRRKPKNTMLAVTVVFLITVLVATESDSPGRGDGP
jgi:hypothetical protein